MSMEIMYVRTCVCTSICPSTSDRQTAHAQMLFKKSAGFAAACSRFRICPNHKKKVTVRRDWNNAGNRTTTRVLEKGLTRETEGGVSTSSSLVCIALLSCCLSTVKECDLVAVQFAGRCSVCHFAHACSIVLSISLV